MPEERPTRVWLIDDDDDLRPALAQSLALDGHDVTAFADPLACLAAFGADAADVVVSDIRMPGIDGRELLRRLRGIDPRVPMILVTGHGDVPLAVEAMREGAFDFIEKPFDAERLAHAIARATQAPEPAIAPLPLLGSSEHAERLRRDFERLARANAGGLIVGPPGSGHNRLLVHLLAPFEAAGRPIVRINCGNLAPDLAELELLGERGAFERAAQGAIALETFSLLPDAARRAVVEALDRPGAPVLFVTLTSPTRVDEALSDAFGARRIDLPPLGHRREDVASIFVAFARQSAERFRRPVPPWPAGLEAWLFATTFEGNVSEVQALAERFVLGTWTFDEVPAPPRLAERVAAHERLLIEAELERNGGRIRPTYEALGLSRKGLYDKMRRYGLHGEGG